MFSKVTDFFSRHRRKFVVTGVVVGGSYLAYRYAMKKLIEYQENQTKDFLEQTRRSQHYESTERTCNQVIVGLSSKMFDEIIKLLNSEAIMEQLRNNPTPENKIELWNGLKVLSLTRLTVFIYASSMLTITLRTQVNVLGGYLFKDNAKVGQKTTVTEDIREKYLSLIQYFLESGIEDLVNFIKKQVAEVMSGHELAQPITISDIEQIFWSIQMGINSNIEHDPNSKMSKYVLPKELQESTPTLQQLFNETVDLLESDELIALSSNNICRGFSIAVDNIAEYLDGSSGPKIQEVNGNQLPDVTKQLLNINRIELPLVKLIPILLEITTKGMNSAEKPQNLATSLTTFYMVNDKIKTLGANIYESFST